MSKSNGIPSSSSGTLLNDFSYLNMGDIDISSKKGHGKYRYQSEQATNTSSAALKSDAFYFDGKIHSEENQYFPDNEKAPPSLTEADFLIGSNHETFQGDDDEDDEDGAYLDENGENDKAPEMSNEFYMEIDQFLKKPPPKVHLDDPGSGKKKKKKPLKQQKPSHFPPISQTSYDLYQNEYNLDQLPPPNLPVNEEDYLQQLEESHHHQRGKRSKKKGSNNTSNLYQNPINPNKDTKPRAIDNQLLREAFAYTDQLLREAVIDEANSMTHQDLPQGSSSKTRNLQPRSAPADLPQSKHKHIEEAYSSTITTGKSQKKKSSSSSSTASHKVNVVRQLKQSKQLQHDNEFSIGIGISDTEGPDLKRNAVNYDELVYNFQHGVNLEKLRKELQQSKQSLAQSEGIIRELSTQYLRK